jgi:putative alpha-1,2-mannosidase
MRYREILAGLVVAATGFAAVAVAGTTAWAAVVADPASVVDMRVMSTGGGNDFPGADMPFGMVQWSPDTSPNRPFGGGYNFNSTQFRGFSLTHMAGPGRAAMQDLPILPMTGGLPAGDPGVHLEPFTHTGEVAQARYYSVNSGAGSAINAPTTPANASTPPARSSGSTSTRRSAARPSPAPASGTGSTRSMWTSTCGN